MAHRDFAAPRWMRNAHVQTLGAAFPFFSPPRSHLSATTEELRVPLGEAHALHARAWWAGRGDRAERVSRRPAVVIVHGIGGSSDSRTVVRTAVALHRAGFHVVRFDLRGAGASVPDVPTLYHAGLSADLGVVAAHVAADPRVSGVFLFGYSGGGTMALKLAGEWGDAPPPYVRGVISASAPLDYTRVAPWMDTALRSVYRFHILGALTSAAKTFATLHPARAHYRASDVKRMSSFRHYDGTIIVPMHGFTDVDLYYEAAGAGPWLPKISVPTLLLHAEDDPMVPFDTVRPWLPRASKSVEVVLSKHGGHMGWLGGIDEASWVETWPSRRALRFLSGLEADAGLP